MGKSTVTSIVTKVKRRVDYDIDDSDLDNLLVDIINDCLKVLRQKLVNAGIYIDAASTVTLTTTASQAYIDLSMKPSAPTATLITIGTGLLSNGDYLYKVSYVTADGESLPSDASTAVTVDAAHNKITVTIPTSNISDVTSRKIYRTAAGGTVYYLLATVSNNTATSYTDNIADATLIAGAAITSISTIPSYSDIIQVSERTNDSPIEIISYERLVELTPDPTANTSSTPDYCAVYNERLYLSPTPSGAISIYVEYIKHLTELALTSNLPYETQYDPLLIAMVSEWYQRWFDKSDREAIKTAEELVLRLEYQLITGAAKNINLNRQSQSRREGEIIAPRIPQ